MFFGFIQEYDIKSSLSEIYKLIEGLLLNTDRKINRISLPTISSNLLVIVNQSLSLVNDKELKVKYESVILKLVTSSILLTLRYSLDARFNLLIY